MQGRKYIAGRRSGSDCASQGGGGWLLPGLDSTPCFNSLLYCAIAENKKPQPTADLHGSIAELFSSQCPFIGANETLLGTTVPRSLLPAQQPPCPGLWGSALAPPAPPELLFKLFKKCFIHVSSAGRRQTDGQTDVLGAATKSFLLRARPHGHQRRQLLSLPQEQRFSGGAVALGQP